MCAPDQPMVEVMTDKATVEIPAPRAGRDPEADVRRGADLPGGQGAGEHRGERGRRRRRLRGRATTPRRHGHDADRVAVAGHDARRRQRPRQRRRQRRRRRRERAGDAGDAEAGAGAGRRSRARCRARGPAGRITSDDVRAHAGHANGGGGAGGVRPAAAGAAAARRAGRGGRARPVPRRAAEDRREPGEVAPRRRRTSPTSRRSTAPSWSACARRPTPGWRQTS